MQYVVEKNKPGVNTATFIMWVLAGYLSKIETMFQLAKDGSFHCKDYCCIRRSRSGAHILDVVARWAELEPLGISQGVWGGYTLGIKPHVKSLIVHLYADILITILRCSADSNSSRKQLQWQSSPHTWLT
jgi:hypothetical protein